MSVCFSFQTLWIHAEKQKEVKGLPVFPYNCSFIKPEYKYIRLAF